MSEIKFYKYHGLGNDYIVIDPYESVIDLDSASIIKICDRNRGVGSDGILLGSSEENDGFSVRIFNPDGTEAEKSGNGLRIFSRYLWDKNAVKEKPFRIRTIGGTVTSQIIDPKKMIKIEMGRVSFEAQDIPVLHETGEVLNKNITIDDQNFTYCAATIGNPHCVVLSEAITPEIAKKYGCLIETDSRFPNKTNVQFLKVLDKENIQIEIWERGAGYTLASGSSSTASAAVAFKLGLCGNSITVHMPGGALLIEFDDFNAIMSGPVCAVCEGIIKSEIFEERT